MHMENSTSNFLEDWRNNFGEMVIIAGTIGSGVTTWVGAYTLVSENALVATLLAVFFQGGLFTVAHLATDKIQPHRHPRKIALLAAWLLLASFSVYASALGMFELVKPSLKSDNLRTDIVAQWRDAEKEIATFKTNALAWLTKAKDDVNLKLAFERNRERFALSKGVPYRPARRLTMTAQLETLTSAESTAQAVKLLSGTTPAKVEDAIKMLDDAFALAKNAYAALPDEGKALCPEPRRTLTPVRPEETQKAFWAEARAGSAPVKTMFLFAFLLDFLPGLLRYASRPKRTLAEKIHSSRVAGKELWVSLVNPLSPLTTAIRLAVVGHPDMDIKLNLASGTHHLTLRDMRGDLEEVGNEITRIVGGRLRLRSAMNSSKMEIVPDFPLLDQLDDDLTLHVDFETEPAEVRS
jgi:hypothetical protein